MMNNNTKYLVRESMIKAKLENIKLTQAFN